MNEKLEKIIEKSKFKPKSDVIFIKLHPPIHELSKEAQIYFRNLTEILFGYNEQLRCNGLNQLSNDYHIKIILPQLCRFIKNTIDLNLIKTDLTLLIYAMRMIKSLLINKNCNLKPYIHELLPAVLSCCLAKKICKYFNDNHWILRDFSAFLVLTICQQYSDNLNNMKQRVIHIYLKGILDMNKSLATTYGAIKGISNFGEADIKKFLLPNLKLISIKIHKILEISNNNSGIHYYDYQKYQINEAKHVRNIMVVILAPILYKIRNTNDGGISYVEEFGYLGKSLYIQIKHLESIEQAKLQQHQYNMEKMNNNNNNNSNNSLLNSWLNLS